MNYDEFPPIKEKYTPVCLDMTITTPTHQVKCIGIIYSIPVSISVIPTSNTSIRTSTKREAKFR